MGLVKILVAGVPTLQAEEVTLLNQSKGSELERP